MFSEMTINADMREQKTSLDDTDDTCRQLHSDVQRNEFQRALSTRDIDTCDTSACTCSFENTDYSGPLVVKTKGGGNPQLMQATYVEKEQDHSYDLGGSSLKQASHTDPSSSTCNFDEKLLIKDKTEKDSLTDCDEKLGNIHDHRSLNYFSRVACNLSQRSSDDALLAQFLT